MTNHKNRLAQLEASQPPAAQVEDYFCIYQEGTEAEGYTVTQWRGTNPQHFATLADLEAFSARPDVNLTRIVFKYAQVRGAYS